MSEEYAFPVITLAYCHNTTDNLNWCKSHEETDEWLLRHPQYFAYQNTRVADYIYEDHPVVQEHPYWGDTENYFPTFKQLTELSLEVIQLDAKVKQF